MKRIIITLAFIASIHPVVCRAQSAGDLIEQLVLDFQKLQDLKAILQNMYTSYKILDQGYTRIKDIAQGQFNLHKAFLDGLRKRAWICLHWKKPCSGSRSAWYG